MEISNYKKKNIETKYINNMQNIKLLKIKNSLLKLEKKNAIERYRIKRLRSKSKKIDRRAIFKTNYCL